MEQKMRSESFGQLFKRRQSAIATILIIATTLMISGLTPTAQATGKDYSSDAYKLEHISMEKASSQILELGLPVQINKVEKAKTLIVTTSSKADRIKVASVIKLIDSRFPYEVTKLAFNAEKEELPDTAIVNAAVKGIEVGSLTNPPTETVAAKAIIDVNGRNLFSIAPRGLTKYVISGMDSLRSANKLQRQETVSLEKPAAPVKPAITAADAGKNDTVLRLTETARSKISIEKSKPETIYVTAGKPVSVDLATISPTLRQLKEAQKELAEAFKNAEADSVTRFMKDKANAAQIEKLAKNERLDANLLDEIKKLQEKTKASTKSTKTESNPKTAPVTRPETRKDSPRTTRYGSRPDAAYAGKSTVPSLPDKEVKSTKIVSTPKPAPPKKESPGDSLADILKKLEEMKATKTNTTPPVNTKPAVTNPVNTRPVRPVNTRPAITDPVRPVGVKPENTVNAKPPVNKAATSSKNPNELSEEELELTLTLPTNVKITELLELVGKQLKLNYMYDEKQITGDVKLFIHEGQIKVRELYSLVESVLQFKGFVMTRRGKLVTVAKVGEAAGMESEIIGENENVTQVGNVIVTKIFKVKHIDTETAQKTLTDMKLGISITTIPEYGKMIITGYAYRMERIQEVLDMVDLQGRIKEFRHRMLNYLTPSQLAPKLETLAQQLGTVSISVSSAAGPTSSSFSYPPPPKPLSQMSARDRSLYEARKRAALAAHARNNSSSKSTTSTSTIGAATSKSVYLDIDDRTNRILMIGLPESIDIVEKLIDTLDVPQKGISIIRQYKIEYVDASTIIDILAELGITEGGPRPVNTTTSKTARPPVPTTTRGASSGDGPKISLLTETNSLLINATHEKHDEIATIIAHVDVLNPDERTIKIYEIKEVDTQEIIDTLTELGMISGQSSRSSNSRYGSNSSNRTSTNRTSTGRTTAPAPVTPSISTQFSEPLADEPQVAVLETTNSLLVHATAKQHASIEMVVQYVDREPTRDSTPYVIYPLGNLDPIELKKELDVLVDATIEAQTEGKSTGTTSTTPKIINTRTSSGSRDADDRITIVADEETRSLVVYASKKNQQWIGDIITELDKYRSQVLLDVTLVEISKDNEFNLDLDMVTKAGGLATGGSFTQMTKAGSAGVTGLIDPANWGKLIAEAGVTNGSGKAFYADRHIQGLFELMDKKNYGRVLARPSILVKDNQEGQIDATKTIYVGQEKTNVISGTTSNLSTSSDVTFTDYSSGITLTITPHIASDKLLQLDIQLDRTDFDPSDPGKATFGDRTVPKPLNTVSSKVGTTAILPNGATIILGGIETVTQTKGVTKIPILGDIPIFGGLFRGIDESDKQSKLYVFVKANIIRPGDELTGKSDIERISRKKRDTFESDEKKFQGLEGLPGIRPNPMDPEKILEDDEYLKSLKATRPKNYIQIDLE